MIKGSARLQLCGGIVGCRLSGWLPRNNKELAQETMAESDQKDFKRVMVEEWSSVWSEDGILC